MTKLNHCAKLFAFTSLPPVQLYLPHQVKHQLAAKEQLFQTYDIELKVKVLGRRGLGLVDA